METVRCVFYWGGEIVPDPTEGIIYTAEAKGLYNVPRRSTLSALVDMLIPKVAENGESLKLNLICRYPYLTPSGFKYRKLLIKDDETLNNAFDIPARFPNLDLEVYVVVKETTIMGAPPMISPQPGSFSWLLTQESNIASLQSPMRVPPQWFPDVRPDHNVGCYSMQSIGCYGAGPSTISSSPFFGQSIPYNTDRAFLCDDGSGPIEQVACTSNFQCDVGPIIGTVDDTPVYASSTSAGRHMPETTDSPYMGGECGGSIGQYARSRDIECGADYGFEVDSMSMRENSEDSDDNAMMYGDIESDDDDGHIEPRSHNGEIPSVDEVRTPIPFFMNNDLVTDGFIMRNDIVPRADVWTPADDEFKEGMLFKDKKTLQNAVKLYYTKKNRQYKVVESRRTIWRCACENDCAWKLRASITKNTNGLFQIKKYVGPHHCVYPRTSRDHRNLDSTFIAVEIMSTIKVSDGVLIKIVF